MKSARKFTPEEIAEFVRSNRLDLFYNSRYWRRLARAVIAEQNNECQRCKSFGRVGRAAIAHHFKPLRERPDLAYSRYYIDEQGNKQRQLVALCFACHEEIHGRVFKGNVGKRKGYTNEEKF